MDIKLILKENIKSIDNLENNYIVINFKGNDINNIIINTLRVYLLRYIPIYAFDSKYTQVFSTSIFNNDMIKLILNNLPITLMNIDDDINYEDNINKVNDLKNGNFNNNDDKSLSMFISIKNESKEVMNVTTDDAKFELYNKKKIKSNDLFKRKILLCYLREGEEIKLSCKSILNIAYNDYKWAAVKTPCGFKEILDNEYDLKIESRRQMSEIECIKRACKIIINKFNELKTKILNDFEVNKKNNLLEGNILIENEDDCIGNLISYYLQENKNVLYASYKMTNFLEKNIII